MTLAAPVSQPFSAPFGLYGYHWPAPSARAAVLLQHGYAEHAGRYVDHANRLVPALVAAGFDVFAFDMAGHGRSQGRRGDTDVGRMVSAHLQMRERIVAAGGRPLFLFGHSLGGLVTASSVVRASEGLAGVVLSAPALPLGIARVQRLALRLLTAVAPALGVQRMGDPSALSRIEAEVAAYLSDPLVFRRALPARLAASALDCADAMWRGLAGWRAPTLVVHGSADTATDPQASEQLIGLVPAADKEFMLLPQGRHEPLNDVPRDAVLAHILDWLGRRAEARAAA